MWLIGMPALVRSAAIAISDTPLARNRRIRSIACCCAGTGTSAPSRREPASATGPLLALGFAGAFRRAELVALEAADLLEVADGLRVVIRHSKTDREGQGQEVAIPRGYRLQPDGSHQAGPAVAEIITGRSAIVRASSSMAYRLSRSLVTSSPASHLSR